MLTVLQVAQERLSAFNTLKIYLTFSFLVVSSLCHLLSDWSC